MYVKLFQKILDSTINETDLATRWTWITCMLLADDAGYFTSTPQAIARRANIAPEQVMAALQILTAPDPQSTTETDEGRRLIQSSQNHWQVVNYERYREIATRADQQAYDRGYSKARRDAQKEQRVGESRSASETIGKGRLSEAEADADPEEDRTIEQKNIARDVATLSCGSHVTSQAPDAGASPAQVGVADQGPEKGKKKPIAPKPGIKRSITFDVESFTLHGITAADRAQWQAYAPGIDVDAEIDAFLDYMQTHPEALTRTLKTGAWKAALNTRFRNAIKFGAQVKGAQSNKGGNFALAGKTRPVGVTDEDVAMFGDRYGNLPASIKLLRRMQHEQAQAGTDAANVEVIS